MNSLFRRFIVKPKNARRLYSGVMGVTYNYRGQVETIRLSQEPAVPIDPSQCQWEPITSIDAERLDAGLVHKTRSEVYGDLAQFFMVRKIETQSS